MEHEGPLDAEVLLNADQEVMTDILSEKHVKENPEHEFAPVTV